MREMTRRRQEVLNILAVLGHPDAEILPANGNLPWRVKGEFLADLEFATFKFLRSWAVRLLWKARPDLVESGGLFTRPRLRPGVMASMEDFLAGRAKEIRADVNGHGRPWAGKKNSEGRERNT